MIGGYAGKIAYIDLTTGEVKEEFPSPNVYRDFIGGTGLGVRILYELMKPKADPLGPENILGFVTGTLTATPTPGSGRFTVVTKSPLTGAWADANSGGFWGPTLKQAGFDAVFISGRSLKPVYILFSGGKAEIRDASYLWGKTTNETDDILQKEVPGARVACIGPAGETLSLIAGIVNERGRIAARSGVGAVMGSKKLKAVVVKDGNIKISIAKPQEYKSVRHSYTRKLKDSQFHQGLTAAGTGGGTSYLLSIGDCPTKNWNTTGTDSMPTATNLDSANMNKYKLRNYGCHACPIRCGAIVEVKVGTFATRGEVHRPEYETLAAFGTLCLNDNVESIIKANEICNLYGLDTMAVGNLIAFAMECFEKGLITMVDTDGIELSWGNAEAVTALAEKIAKREGFGSLLADGILKATEHIGKGTDRYAMHIGGHRVPYHDPRTLPCKGTTYIADSQPSCHMDSEGTGLLEQGIPLGSDPVLQPPGLAVYGDYEKKGAMYADGNAYYQLLSSAGLCSLYTVNFAVPVAELIASVTGWDYGWEEGLKAGRRILTLRQTFNAREGVNPKDFKLPERLTGPALVGPSAGTKIDFDTLKESYFKALGWDMGSGKPNPQTLESMGLEKLTADL
jgi:aldehyde:ferredoxin oxidoreductase